MPNESYIAVTGRCLCGDITLSAEVLPEVCVCYCADCQRQNSGPLFSLQNCRDVEITGHPARYRSSATAERGFCRDCGSTLFWQHEDGEPELSAGVLDQPAPFRIVKQLFTDHRPAHLGGLLQGDQMNGQ